jgi:glycosyltransferase involved in cell wall biosynthesis
MLSNDKKIRTSNAIATSGPREHVAMLKAPMRLDPETPIVLYVDVASPGGTAVYAVNLAGELKRAGYRVAVICGDAPESLPMRDQLAAAGVNVHTIRDDDVSPLGRIRRLRDYFLILRPYRGGVLCLLLGNYVSGGPVMLAGAAVQMGAIVRADLQPPMPPFNWWRHRAAIQLKDLLVNCVVVGNDENRRAFVWHTGRSGSKIAVIHTGIDLTRFEPEVGRREARVEFGYSPERIVVGAIARLEEERKGVASFIDMAAIVGADCPSASFLVVGSGPLKPILELQAEHLNIRDRVAFVGWRGDLERVLAALDVFVMPSLYEGGPTIVLEAMAMAKAVVATRVGMVPEVITSEETGLIVEAGDSEQLARAVCRLVENTDLRQTIGQAARKRAVRCFSRSQMADRYLELFASSMRARSATKLSS